MSSLTQQLVLKEGNVFLVSHENGDISGNTGLGLYYHDIRYLSRFVFEMNGEAPPLLNFSGYRNFMGTLQFANPLFLLPDGHMVLPQTISVRRSRFISEGLHERIGFASYNRFPVPITATLTFGADFRDIFDVRGFRREKWGQLLEPEWDGEKLVLRYLGVDGVQRHTQISFERLPDKVDIEMPSVMGPIVEPGVLVPAVGSPSYHIIFEPPVATLTWNFVLETNKPLSIAVQVLPEGEAQAEEARSKSAARLRGAIAPPQQGPGGDGRFDRAVNYMRFSYYNWDTQSTTFSTDNEEFNQLLKRSKYDLRVLSEPEEGGYFPNAGIPWYACPFGRDSIITSLQTLSLNPDMAVATLRVLARYQGAEIDPWREEQPGKILHEIRFGEMARLHMVPHSPYYGTVDATPLFVLLFVEAMRWLDDDALYEELLPNVRRAVEWIDKYGDVDGDGFVEYAASTTEGGIRNQVWKDSHDSMQWPDGRLVETPIAGVEVQAYVYAAKLGLGELLHRKGQHEEAARLVAEAVAMRERFNKAFWMEDAGFFTQGLDKDKRQVLTISSNPGHCLWCNIVDTEKAALVKQRLLEPDMMCGWGIRTISDQSPSYNPMSYHNGSVWPHDNSIIAAGFKQYGYHEESNDIATQIVEAAQHFRYSRLPELYCGFTRDKVYHSGPAEYPVSCSPQAWAAGTPILMLQTMLGLQVDAHDGRARISPHLPEWLNTVHVQNLRIGEKRVDLRVDRHDGRNEVFLAGGSTGISLEVV